MHVFIEGGNGDMPYLTWAGKDEVVNHDKKVPFRLLKKIDSLSLGESTGNAIIHGDNLEALKALMPYYYGKVKCIYIDPPYNTGNEGWVYNDKVNSPKIKKWLGKVVGGESEDLCRHDKWLCMMYPRLKLLRELLRDDGVIFVSIDDNESHRLRMLMDEIWGEENFISEIVWQKKTGASDAKGIAVITEYVCCYVKSIEKISDTFEKNKESHNISRYKFKDDHFEKRGPYYIDNLDRGGLQYSDSLNFPIICPDGKETYPNGRIKFKKDGWIWKWSKQKIKWALQNDFIEFRKSKSKESQWSVCYKNYLLVNNKNELIERAAPVKNLITDILNAESAVVIKDLFENNIFKYSKPKNLISTLIKFIKYEKGDIILDSFAGSGTTGHAVMQLNKEDGGDRKFILIEMEDYAKDITAERIKRVIKKEDYQEGFSYYELDGPLFDEYGAISPDCSFHDLAEYLYFTETQNNLNGQTSGSFLGSFAETDYYLLFDPHKISVFNKTFLHSLGQNAHKKVVYADKLSVDLRILSEQNIEFKQIPYGIRIY